MPLKNKKILVIDDTDSIRTFLRIALEAQGATLYEASNAAEGIELCNSMQPDLVVLDLGLPDRDGLDILPELKSADDNKHIPVVVILSVRKDHSTVNKANLLGVDGYISKPFMMDELLDIIDTKLRVKSIH